MRFFRLKKNSAEWLKVDKKEEKLTSCMTVTADVINGFVGFRLVL
jgi:hypothetical protein